MCRIAFATRCFAALYLSWVLSAMGPNEVIAAEIHRPVVTLEATQDPEVAVLRLKFDLRLTNRSSEAVYLPREDGVPSEATRFVLLGVQVKQPDGKWAAIAQSSWYDVGTTKYAVCNAVAAGKAPAFGTVASGVVVLRKQLDALEKQPSIRLRLMTLCRQPGGTVITNTMITDPFRIQLPR